MELDDDDDDEEKNSNNNTTMSSLLAMKTMNNDNYDIYNNITSNSSIIPINNIITMMTVPSNQIIDNNDINNFKKLQNNIAKHFLQISSSKSLPSWRDFPSCLSNNDDNVIYRKSGFRVIDDIMLSMGYPMGHVINYVGNLRSGKTQLSMATAVCTAIDGENVIIFDVSNSMHEGRLQNIVKFYLSLKLDYYSVIVEAQLIEMINDVLSRINIVKVFTPWDLLGALTNINIESTTTYGVVIVDCFSSVFTPYMNTSKGNELITAGQSNQNPKSFSSDHVSIDNLVSTTLIMLRNLTNKGSTVIITNNSISERQPSRSHQLRDMPDYLFQDMVDFIITLEADDNKPYGLVHLTCILRPPWYLAANPVSGTINVDIKSMTLNNK